jgi:hypothetical protein
MSIGLGLADYTRIYSNDGSEFVAETRVVPKGFPTNLNYPAKIVETIISYLYFKFHNARKNLNKLPAFDIDPVIALELLKAATDLSI